MRPRTSRRPSHRRSGRGAAPVALALALLVPVACSDESGSPSVDTASEAEESGTNTTVATDATDATDATETTAEEPESTGTTAPSSSEAPTDTVTATTEHDHGGASAVAGPASPEGMVEIATGTYQIGIDTPDQESLPLSDVELAAPVHVDVFEVSNQQYFDFVKALGAPAPTTWPTTGMPAEIAQLPVTSVPWVWADSFCRSIGKRLPTEAEWEIAARGPEAALYPWGDDPTVVSLDVAGTQAVGAQAANVSSLGVHDTVGSVWEWVGTPAQDVTPGQRVRRGGEYGRVRHGAAHRQAVDPNNVSVLEETGFRCATDSVDDSIEPYTFTSGHAPADDGTSVTVPPVSLAPGEFVDEVFEDPRSGWVDTKADGWTTGYHAPTWYHLDIAQPNVQITAIAPYRYDDAVVETKVFIDKVGTETGQFRYGLLFRADGALTPSPDGVGPDRPRDFYVLAINPRAGIWELLHEDNLPLRVKVSGPLPDTVTASSASPDRLKVSMVGSSLVMWVNEVEVARFDTQGYHLTGGVGFFSQTFDETKLHVHFDELSISEP